MRTTEVAVRNVLQTSLTTAQLTTFIEDASLWVTEELADGYGFSAERLELIERYLACALVRARDVGLTSATIKDITEKYQVDPEVTEYLRRAASFDSSGKVFAAFLPEVESTPVVRFRVGTGFAAERNTL